MPRIKLVHIMSNLDKALEFEWLADGIDKTQFELSFILLNPEPGGALAAFAQARGLAVHHVPLRGKKDFPAALLQCWRLLRRIRPYVVHAHLFEGSLLGLLAAKLAGVRCRIHTRHHSSWHHVYFPHMVKYDRLINALSHRVVAISRSVSDILTEQEGVDPRKVTIIHHGIDFSMIDRVEPAVVEGLRAKYNPEGKGPVVGVISRYTEWKGVQHIVPAFGRLLEKHPNALLLLANPKGEYRPKIVELLQRLPAGSYREIPFEPQVFALYRLFDVFVHVPIDRHSEAFGQTYIEALASNVPSVFTRSGCANDFAVHLENCYAADHASSDSIYEGLDLLLSSPDTVARIVASGQALVREQYHFGLKMSKLEALYRACID